MNTSFPISRDPPEGGTFTAYPQGGGLWLLEEFPISRDPPEGGTKLLNIWDFCRQTRFQFLGIPPKGELDNPTVACCLLFPISRDPPEGGTWLFLKNSPVLWLFPISRDPPEGGTRERMPGSYWVNPHSSFQFLGIPPKGELCFRNAARIRLFKLVSNF
jgi:hypothetical protein